MGEPNEKEPRIDAPLKDSETVDQEGRSETQSDQRVTTSPGTVRKKHRLGGERICRVCGDKAVAHNFDVISCESCKTFFRRNAHKTQKDCAFEGKCEITVQTRRFCPACRLKKCFSVGMRADMILDEVERQARMEKIMTNRKKRQEAAKKDNSASTNDHNTNAIHEKKDATSSTVCCPDSCTDLDPGLNPSGSTSEDVDNLLSELAQYETQQQQDGLTTSQSNSQLHTHPDAAASNSAPRPERTSTVTSNSSGNNNTNTSNNNNNSNNSSSQDQPRSPTFQHVPPSLLPTDPLMYWRLTSEEHHLITDLTIAYKEAVLRMPMSEEALRTQLETLSLRETLTYCQRFALEIINFLKRVPDFKTLSIHDQQAVLKANAMFFMMIKSSACFSEESEAWVKEFGVMTVDAFARMTQNEEVVKRYADFCRALKRILKNDYTAYVLITCMVLFEPQAANVLDRQNVNILKDKYCTLLKHYLESQFSYVFAGQYHDALQESISHGKVLSAEMILMFSNWKEFLQPLMVEVMNLR